MSKPPSQAPSRRPSDEDNRDSVDADASKTTLQTSLLVQIAMPAFKISEHISFKVKPQTQSKVLDSVEDLVQCLSTELTPDLMAVDKDSSDRKLELLKKRANADLADWMAKFRLVDEWKLKVDRASSTMNKMRDAYYKELFHLREQVYQKGKAQANDTDFQPMYALHFDPSEYSLDDEVGKLVAAKVGFIQQEFDTKLREVELRYTTRISTLNESVKSTKMLLARKEKMMQKMREEGGYEDDDENTRGVDEVLDDCEESITADFSRRKAEEKAVENFHKAAKAKEPKPETLVQFLERKYGSLGDARSQIAATKRLGELLGPAEFEDLMQEIGFESKDFKTVFLDLSEGSPATTIGLIFDRLDPPEPVVPEPKRVSDPLSNSIRKPVHEDVARPIEMKNRRRSLEELLQDKVPTMDFAVDDLVRNTSKTKRDHGGGSSLASSSRSSSLGGSGDESRASDHSKGTKKKQAQSQPKGKEPAFSVRTVRSPSTGPPSEQPRRSSADSDLAPSVNRKSLANVRSVRSPSTGPPSEQPRRSSADSTLAPPANRNGLATVVNVKKSAKLFVRKLSKHLATRKVEAGTMTAVTYDCGIEEAFSNTSPMGIYYRETKNVGTECKPYTNAFPKVKMITRGCQSTIDKLMLDKAVEFYERQAEVLWNDLADIEMFDSDSDASETNTRGETGGTTDSGGGRRRGPFQSDMDDIALSKLKSQRLNTFSEFGRGLLAQLKRTAETKPTAQKAVPTAELDVQTEPVDIFAPLDPLEKKFPAHGDSIETQLELLMDIAQEMEYRVPELRLRAEKLVSRCAQSGSDKDVTMIEQLNRLRFAPAGFGQLQEPPSLVQPGRATSSRPTTASGAKNEPAGAATAAKRCLTTGKTVQDLLKGHGVPAGDDQAEGCEQHDIDLEGRTTFTGARRPGGAPRRFGGDAVDSLESEGRHTFALGDRRSSNTRDSRGADVSDMGIEGRHTFTDQMGPRISMERDKTRKNAATTHVHSMRRPPPVRLLMARQSSAETMDGKHAGIHEAPLMSIRSSTGPEPHSRTSCDEDGLSGSSDDDISKFVSRQPTFSKKKTLDATQVIQEKARRRSADAQQHKADNVEQRLASTEIDMLRDFSRNPEPESQGNEVRRPGWSGLIGESNIEKRGVQVERETPVEDEPPSPRSPRSPVKHLHPWSASGTKVVANQSARNGTAIAKPRAFIFNSQEGQDQIAESLDADFGRPSTSMADHRSTDKSIPDRCSSVNPSRWTGQRINSLKNKYGTAPSSLAHRANATNSADSSAQAHGANTANVVGPSRHSADFSARDSARNSGEVSPPDCQITRTSVTESVAGVDGNVADHVADWDPLQEGIDLLAEYPLDPNPRLERPASRSLGKSAAGTQYRKLPKIGASTPRTEEAGMASASSSADPDPLLQASKGDPLAHSKDPSSVCPLSLPEDVGCSLRVGGGDARPHAASRCSAPEHSARPPQQKKLKTNRLLKPARGTIDTLAGSTTEPLDGKDVPTERQTFGGASRLTDRSTDNMGERRTFGHTPSMAVHGHGERHTFGSVKPDGEKTIGERPTGERTTFSKTDDFSEDMGIFTAMDQQDYTLKATPAPSVPHGPAARTPRPHAKSQVQPSISVSQSDKFGVPPPNLNQVFPGGSAFQQAKSAPARPVARKPVGKR